MCVACPASLEEVRQLVVAANQFKIALYPISRGRNWGYGDACPVGSGQVIVDLGKMNRIVEVNTTLGYAVVEPGVTFGQLAQHLADINAPFWLDVTGAGPDTSVLGNTLERGFGHTTHADHYSNSAGYEVVLGDGRVTTTGFGHMAGARAAYAYKSGIGPALDGLFSQSNFGIVTRMGIWLQPKPEYLRGFIFSTPDRNAIGDLIERLRPLRQLGIIPSAVHIGNDLRLASGQGRFPWERLDGKSSLPDAIRAEYASGNDGAAWIGLGGLYGTRRTVKAAYAEICSALRGLAKVRFVDDQKLALYKRSVKLLNRFGLGQQLQERIRNVERAYGLLRGHTTPEFLNGAGWRSRSEMLPNNSDPLDNRWGTICLAPIAPQTGVDVSAALAISDRIYLEYGFEPLITVNMLTTRACCLVMNICFDKESNEEAQRAHDCAKKLMQNMAHAGFHSYRCGTWAMSQIVDESSPYWQIVSSLKMALDPNGVIAPGRYAPTHHNLSSTVRPVFDADSRTVQPSVREERIYA